MIMLGMEPWLRALYLENTEAWTLLAKVVKVEVQRLPDQ